MSANPKHILPPSMERLRAIFDARLAVTAEVQTTQSAALARFLAHGFPTPREEEWRYTDLRRLQSRNFQPASLSAAAAGLPLPDFDSARLVFINGTYSAAHSEAFCAGLRVRTWTRAGGADKQLTAQILQEPNGVPVSALRDLNTAFLEAAVLLELADGVHCEKPVHLLHVWTAAPSQMSHPRVVVRIGKGSRMTLIEHYLGTANDEQFTNAQTFVTVEQNAELTHCRLQEEALKAFHIGAVHTNLQRDSRYHFTELALGGGLGRTDLGIRLEAAGTRAEVDGLFFPRGTQHLDVHTRIDHIAPRTWSDENYRGIADERGRGVFSGKAVVHPGAQKIEAHQSSRNLLLSAQAEIDSKPDLEIYADDVKCSHGATTGRLDQASLFYLRSRGIGEQEARVLLIHAFAESVLSAVPGDALRTYLHYKLADKLSLPLGVPA
jgi:Fe-S cluster assembly protein SufD